MPRVRSHLQATARPCSHPARSEHTVRFFHRDAPANRGVQPHPLVFRSTASLLSCVVCTAPSSVNHRARIARVQCAADHQNRTQLRLLDRYRPGIAGARHHQCFRTSAAPVSPSRHLRNCRPGPAPRSWHRRRKQFTRRQSPLLHSVSLLPTLVAGAHVRSYKFSSNESQSR